MLVVRPGAQVRAFAVLFTGLLCLAVAPNQAQARSHRHHTSVRSHHVSLSRSGSRRSRSALRSRGVTETRLPATEVVVGRLGVVTDDSVPINASREDYGRLLSRVDKGTNLTITGETDTYYAVLMIDKSIGFIAKDKVNLLDYEVTANQTLPSGAQAGPLGQALIQTAVQFMGVPYLYGGESTTGIDCSAFVKSVYAANGLTLPRTAAEQAAVGTAVSTTDVSTWVPGDRIYFQCHHDYIDHAGMYIGNGYFIHSSIGNHGVAVTRIDDLYYWNHIVTVRRSPQLAMDSPTGGVSQTGAQTADSESTQQ